MTKRVLLGMSGGIDSTVSALLLLEQGYEVVGVTFRTYDSMKDSCVAKEKGCCTIESIMEAKHNAERMGFEHRIVDFRDTFKRCVIQNFIDEYMSGRTPNPCVLCNSTIKWGEMLQLADELGCDFIATGHYARIAERDGHIYLRTAADTHKDQTYFLWMLTEEQLRRTIFPLGDYTKDHVREIARSHGYEKLATKRERYASFLTMTTALSCARAYPIITNAYTRANMSMRKERCLARTKDSSIIQLVNAKALASPSVILLMSRISMPNVTASPLAPMTTSMPQSYASARQMVSRYLDISTSRHLQLLPKFDIGA